MRAYLIDPVKHQITEVDYTGSLYHAYDLLGVSIVEAAQFNTKRDVVYVDEEGLLKQPVDFFCLPAYPQLLAGRGLVVGTTRDGDDKEPAVDRDWLVAHVGFVNLLGGVASVKLPMDRAAAHFCDQLVDEAMSR